MAVRNVQESDFELLASLYRSFFKVHDIFQEGNIVEYLKEKSEKDDLLVYDQDGIVKGALFLVCLSKGDHSRWKFRHFAFETEEIGTRLLEEAEKRVKESSKTAKIELTIAETEEGKEFYLKNGYKEEGKLENHYRFGESCFVLGKSFG